MDFFGSFSLKFLNISKASSEAVPMKLMMISNWYFRAASSLAPHADSFRIAEPLSPQWVMSREPDSSKFLVSKFVE